MFTVDVKQQCNNNNNLFAIKERNEAQPEYSLGNMHGRYNPCIYGLAHGHALGVCLMKEMMIQNGIGKLNEYLHANLF